MKTQTDERIVITRKAFESALKQTVTDVVQGCEALYHNLNTLQSRSGQQLPFSSINYGTCTLPEGRMVIDGLLEASLDGVGPLHKTPIFPCGIFQYMKGVNDKPGTPNYDMFRKALKSTSLRLYPNYANVDWSGNAGYDPADPKTYFSTMGALDKKEHLYVMMNHDGVVRDMSIEELFQFAKTGFLTCRPANIAFTKASLSLPGKTKRVQDHTLTTSESRPGVYAITYIPDDVTYIGSSGNMQQRWREHRVAIRTTGGPDCGIKYGDPELENYRFEVLEYADSPEEAHILEQKYILSMPNVNVRGASKRYFKNMNRKQDPIYERPNFPQDKTIPQELFDLSDVDVMVYDRDDKWTKVRHIFRNDRRNSPFMMHIRYSEFGVSRTLSCTEDHPLWTGESFVEAAKLEVGDHLYRADGVALPILEISWHFEPCDSYDIGTETGTFVGSDIIMHNCRTTNGADINADEGQHPMTKDGRGNLAPVTIIMPTLAMLADGDVEKFMELLDEKIHEAKDQLLERYHYMCSQSPASATFMYGNRTMLGYKPEEGIESALKHGTLVIGQLGLAETLQLLIGCDHTEPAGMALAKRIEQLFKDRCAEFKQTEHLNFGVYYTPAENLCYTAMKKFQDEYGIIDKVSDHDYFTNSMHVPVWHDLTPFEKIDIESQLTGYSNAGCITYVELDSTTSHNIDALEKLVTYAMDADIPYFAINVPVDTCMNCGWSGEINDACPKCGEKEAIQRLRRVTGYLTNDYKTAFNLGKQQEVEQRVKHKGMVSAE